MRRMFATLVLVLATGGCSTDNTGPVDDSAAVDLEAMASFAYGVTVVGDPGSDIMARLAALPADLALTAAQRTQIEAAITAFAAATAADRAALAAVVEQAKAARAAGKTPEEVRAILATATAIRERLAQAQRGLHTTIMAVLTPAQRAALNGRQPPPPTPCSTLTTAQRDEISALRAAFEQSNAADITVVRSAHERARAARDAGATREQVAAILAEARAALERLTAARVTLVAAVNAVLTPEQRAAGCLQR